MVLVASNNKKKIFWLISVFSFCSFIHLWFWLLLITKKNCGCFQFYYDTREAELAGGEEIMNGQRRRTSGGLFIQIVKRSGLSREEVALVFPPDEAQLQWRRRKRAATRRKNKDRERHNSTGPGGMQYYKLFFFFLATLFSRKLDKLV